MPCQEVLCYSPPVVQPLCFVCRGEWQALYIERPFSIITITNSQHTRTRTRTHTHTPVLHSQWPFWAKPPPGGEAPSNVDLIMSVQQSVSRCSVSVLFNHVQIIRLPKTPYSLTGYSHRLPKTPYSPTGYSHRLPKPHIAQQATAISPHALFPRCTRGAAEP